MSETTNPAEETSEETIGLSKTKTDNKHNIPIDVPADPRLIRRIAQMIKANQPKHENFRACHKKCPNFKTNRCFVLGCLEQKQCWESWHDADGKATKEAPTAIVPDVVD